MLLQAVIEIAMMAAVTGCGKQGTPAAGTSVQASESVNHTEQTAEAENGDTEGRTKQGHLVETLKLAGGTDWGAPSPYLNASRGPGSAKKNLTLPWKSLQGLGL